ncbi:MAG: chemotaxis protein CheW [Cyanobacteria bacterium J06623_7]
MGIKPYLIFKLHDTRYAISAESVTEIFLLPELTPIAEAPPDIVGLLNLHSQYVPVMHLDLRFGHKFDRCHITDSVIVVESQGLQIGLIVHQVETVVEIDDLYIQADLSYGRQNIHQAFVQSVIDLDDEMITSLNIDNLVRHPEALSALLTDEDDSEELLPSNFYDLYFTGANDNTKKLLHQRAVSLKQADSSSNSAKQSISMAIVSITGKYFALDLNIVREFINITRVTAIPCCPEHVIGNINLRGEILTLIDIRQSLDLAADWQQQRSKAVVIEVDDITAGIVVEEVYDVVDFRPEEIKPVPAAMGGGGISSLTGIADYQGQTVSTLDLIQLLRTGVMTVELTA